MNSLTYRIAVVAGSMLATISIVRDVINYGLTNPMIVRVLAGVILIPIILWIAFKK